MRFFLATLAGLLLGAGVIVAVAVAVPRAAQQTPVGSGMPGSMPMSGSSAGSAMMGAPASLAARRLTIQHVQRGCHVWSNGKTTAPTMQLRLKRGQRLTIRDMDVDAHQMIQFGGPARLRMGGPMMMNRSRTLTFPKVGVYRLGTRTVEMPGGMEVETIGPDNKLRLVVTVA